MSAVFPKRTRLADAKDYALVFAEAKRIVSAYFILLYLENALDHSRLGLAISKKHVKKAVDRNRIKRQIREYFRHHQDRCGNLDIVIISRHAVNGADNQQIVRCLDWLWRKLEKPCEV